MKFRYKLKLMSQFTAYILFAKSNFKVSIKKRIKIALNGGFSVNQYYLFGMDKEDNKKVQYLSEYDWFRSRLINKPYDYIINNKFLFNEIIKNKIKTPKILAVKQEKCIRYKNGKINMVSELISKIDGKEVICKPIFKGKGRDIYKIKVESNKIFQVNNNTSSLSKILNLLEKKNNWLLCECIENHNYAKSIYPTSLNTIRIVVVQYGEGHIPHIVYAVHRFGTANSGVVDNASCGGIVAKIDLETGILSEGRSIKNREEYILHPDTGEPIKGVKIPNWKQVKNTILDLSKDIFYLDVIAWDIALTENDLYVIEGNSSTGVNIMQLWEGQKDREFGKFILNKMR